MTETRLNVLFEDESLLIVDKPAGLMVHPSWLDRHETEFAQDMAEQIAGQKLHTLHRLDRPTSGILIFGKSPDVARAMLATFETREVNKYYLAVARGWTPEKWFIDKPLKETLDPIADRKARKDKGAQDARTAVVRLATAELPFAVGRYNQARYSLNLVKPITGRQHQIRKHFRKTSHHLISDTRYGDGRHNKMLLDQFNWKTLGLRALIIEFPHPKTGAMLKVHAGINPDWQRLLGIMGWQAMEPLLESPDGLDHELHTLNIIETE